MRFLLVGEGGRESALAWGLSRSPLVDELICAPGNIGMEKFGECVPVRSGDVESLAQLAQERAVDLVVVGPEEPLVRGIAGLLEQRGIRTFGPRAAGAALEGSKAFAKELMGRFGIPTAPAREFRRSDEATAYAERVGPPLVVKADGLAQGKGVTVCRDLAEARRAIVAALDEGRFGESGRKILIEELLEGEELSVLAFFDGKTIVPMEPAQDYKPVFDGNRGPNTGGMGSYSPVPACSDAVFAKVIERVLEPLAAGLGHEGIPYKGVVYAGLMLSAGEPRVIEFNCRFGDPETQALLPRLESDLAEVLLATVEGRLEEVKLEWSPSACVSVVAASDGYPGEYEIGFPIEGIDEAEAITGLPVFPAGFGRNEDGRLVTSGGRVLAVSALGEDLGAARRLAYDAVARVDFKGIHYRNDIAVQGGPRPSRRT